MKATTLIKQLQDLVAEHGDLEVYFRDACEGNLDHTCIDDAEFIGTSLLFGEQHFLVR